jgi:hypothetical protein
MSEIYSGSRSNVPLRLLKTSALGKDEGSIGFTTDSRIPMKKPCSNHQPEAQMVPRHFVHIVGKVIECLLGKCLMQIVVPYFVSEE